MHRMIAYFTMWVTCAAVSPKMCPLYKQTNGQTLLHWIKIPPFFIFLLLIVLQIFFFLNDLFAELLRLWLLLIKKKYLILFMIQNIKK